jgi:hypothetical protein
MKEIKIDKIDTPANFTDALSKANKASSLHLKNPMLISWYDKERDFESPGHSSECHKDSATPGFVDYAINHQASLKIDMGEGDFIFYYADIL